MALSFLKKAAKVLPDIGEVVSTTGALMDLFNEPKRAASEQAQERAAGQSAALIAAMSDPNNPLYQRMIADRKAQIQASTAQQIRQMMQEGRRQRMIGNRVALFDPERRDETLASMLASGQPAFEAQARQEVLNQLGASSGRAGNLVGQYNPVVQNAQQRQQQQRAFRSDRVQTLGDLMQQGGALYELLQRARNQRVATQVAEFR